MILRPPEPVCTGSWLCAALQGPAGHRRPRPRRRTVPCCTGRVTQKNGPQPRSPCSLPGLPLHTRRWRSAWHCAERPSFPAVATAGFQPVPRDSAVGEPGPHSAPPTAVLGAQGVDSQAGTSVLRGRSGTEHKAQLSLLPSRKNLAHHSPTLLPHPAGGRLCVPKTRPCAGSQEGRRARHPRRRQSEEQRQKLRLSHFPQLLHGERAVTLRPTKAPRRH